MTSAGSVVYILFALVGLIVLAAGGAVAQAYIKAKRNGELEEVAPPEGSITPFFPGWLIASMRGFAGLALCLYALCAGLVLLCSLMFPPALVFVGFAVQPKWLPVSVFPIVFIWSGRAYKKEFLEGNKRKATIIASIPAAWVVAVATVIYHLC